MLTRLLAGVALALSISCGDWGPTARDRALCDADPLYCHNDSVTHCRFDPRDCGGVGGGIGVGGFCRADGECARGFCCFSDDCGRGTCTYECRDDRDCPTDMGCEHDTCFFLCRGDRDCAPGQNCEHDNTVCEY